MRSKDDILAIKELEGTVEYLHRHYEDVVEERDAAHAEVEQLKQALHDARLENSGQAAQLEQKRPEPSRLEIAAQFMVGSFLGAGEKITNKQAFKMADALIAAAREGK
jgi:chromosome segregation ATPase